VPIDHIFDLLALPLVECPQSLPERTTVEFLLDFASSLVVEIPYLFASCLGSLRRLVQ
jgi:hypothetical protein